jgi:hypothetical protein
MDKITEEDFRPSAARLVESLRDTGYTKEAAFADIIDNSLAADATKIRIEISELFGELRVVITDNGLGMSEEQLLSAMRYGSPKRDNPKSLGKFGMGLKTASTAFCQKLTVVTTNGSGIKLRTWDLDVIRNTDKWQLETPNLGDYAEDLEEFEEFIKDKSSGTMVIWEKIDRLISPDSKSNHKKQIMALAKEIEEELSAIFSKFIIDGVQISLKTLDNQEKLIQSWDPLCRGMSFAGENVASRIIPTKTVNAELNNGEEFSFKVTGALIPSQNDLTPEEQSQVRYTLDNQGFYIYREGRLIWHDGWPHRMYKKESKITRLRIELDFTHELDDIFNIDFRKSRVIIPPQVRKVLKEVISPWGNELKRKADKGSDAKASSSRSHSAATNAINKHKGETQNSEITIDDDGAKIKNKHNHSPVSLANVHVYPDLSVRVHEEEALQGNLLWEAALDNEGYTCVRLGESHPYFSRLYETLKGDTEAQKAIDMLLWSLAHAEFGEYSPTNKTVLRGFRQSVSTILDHLSLELPEPDED